jgi:dTMP kinase
MRGLFIAFEGLDQSGKQTQAELLRDRLTESGQRVELLSFPDYTTAIGREIHEALHGGRDYGADVMQLLYVANRYEWKSRILASRDSGAILVCDRYLASSVAYGEAQGLDGPWLVQIQRFLPQPDITFLLDIAPEVSARRKATARDRYERDLALLARVRSSYLQQADSDLRSSGPGGQAGWVRLDADRDKDAVAADVYAAVSARLGV